MEGGYKATQQRSDAAKNPPRVGSYGAGVTQAPHAVPVAVPVAALVAPAAA